MAFTTLRPGVTFESAAAASWARMEKERGRPLDVNRSLASWDVQLRLWEDYQRYLAGGPWAPLALHPKYSWHCLGLAGDTDDDEWVRAHPDHGWRFVVLSEKWHAQYYPALDLHRSEGMPTTGDSAPLTEEDHMLFFTWLVARTKKRIYCWSTFDDASSVTKGEASALNAARNGKVNFSQVTEAQANAILSKVRKNRLERNQMVADAVTKQIDGMLAESKG